MDNPQVEMTMMIKKVGIAGQFAITAYPSYDGEAPDPVTFVGSIYGGPVVMITGAASQVFVTSPERFGPFGKEWVRRFFAE